MHIYTLYFECGKSRRLHQINGIYELAILVALYAVLVKSYSMALTSFELLADVAVD